MCLSLNFSPVSVTEAVMLVIALSADAFVASFAYGSNKIKIPFLSAQVINIICSFVLAVSLLFGTVFMRYIPEAVTAVICFVILLVLGVVKLLDSITKSIIRKNSNLKKEIKFSMFNIHFILNLYANPERADVDSSRILSPAEAVSLAVALSLDGLAVGVGAAFGNVNIWLIVLISLFVNMLAVVGGCRAGNKIAKKTSFDLSWLSGVLIIIIAVLKFFG